MPNKDLGEELDKIEGLKDKEFKVFGITATPTTIGATFAAIGSVIGMLYGGFVLYQKVEEVANLDIGAFEQRMEVIETQVTSINDNVYTIKGDLKGDIRRVEDIVDDIERTVKNDLREFSKDIKAVEQEFEDKINKALNNPLSDM